MLHASVLLVSLMALAQRAEAQAPPGGSAGSGPPLPEMVAPDAAGVDLLNGGRVGTDSAISIGAADAPVLQLTEGGGGFGGTPLGGFHYTDGTYPYTSDFFVLGSRGVSNTFSDGTARNLPDGMALQSPGLVEGDGTRWNFTYTGVAKPYADRYLTTLVRPDGETLTYTYSSVPIGDIRGRLQSVRSSAGYQLNLEWEPAGATFKLKKATLSNRRYAYCDPSSGVCTGSYAWPDISWSTGVSNNTVATTSGLRSVAYGAPQAGATDEWTTKITSGTGIDRFYTAHGSTYASWPTPLYYGRDIIPGPCIGTAAVWKVQEPGAVWNYDWQTACQGFGTATRTDPLGKVASRNAGGFTDELGRTSTYTYIDQWGSVLTPNKSISRVTSLTYPEGNKVTWDWGGVYGPQNLLSTTVTPKPGVGGPSLIWTKGYPAGCTVLTNINCNRPTHEIDARGNRTDYTYDPVHGGILTKTLPAGDSGVRPQVRYAYQQLSAKVLNSSGALVNEAPIWKLVSTSQCRTQASCIGTADEVVTSYTYDDNLLVVTETVRAGDNSASSTVAKTYDHVGNLVSVDGPLAGNADTTRYVYDGLRRLVATMGPDPDGAGSLPVPVTRTTYDGDNKPTLLETGSAADRSDAALAAMTVDRKLVTTYDAAGRKASESLVGGGVAQVANQYAHDAAGRLECTALRMNAAVYGSLPSSACTLGTAGTQGTDRITKNTYDAAGQLLQVREAVGTSLEQAYVTYSYTNNGRQDYIVDANGNRARLVYDGYDRQLQWQFPSTTAPSSYNPSTPATALASAGSVSTTDFEQYGYDANGNRTSFRKRDGRMFGLGYDALNRMTSKIVPDACVSGYACTNVAASATRDVYYSYDLRGLETAARFDSATGADAVTTVYDAFGQQTSSTTSMGGVSRTLGYQYDAGGNRTRLTHPDGNFINYYREGLGRIYYADVNGATPLFYPPYDAAGRVSVLYRWVNGAWNNYTAYGYDSISRLSSASNVLTGGSYNMSATFAYNPASQLTSRTRDNNAYAFPGYVSVNRSYASNGLNQYSSAGGVSFGYDSNGNLTASGSTSYTYDAENRLVGSSTGASLVYDPLGRLYETYSPSIGTTRFLYDGDQLTAEYDGSGNMLRRYVHSDGDDDPLVWYEGAGISSPRYLYTDHQGSITAITNASGGAIYINSYDEYGIPGSGNGGRFQYTGQAWLPELGMYYYKARIYSPTLGRFLQTDPIGYNDQMNLYAYVANDPVNHTDPTGMECEGFWKCLTGGTYDNGDGTVRVESSVILRTLVPGQVAWDDARTAWANGNRTEAVVHTVRMAGEIGLTVSAGGAARAATTRSAFTRETAQRTAAINPRIYTQLEKQLARDGPRSINTALKSAERTLAQHQAKLQQIIKDGGHKSQVEGTIRNVSSQIQTLKQFKNDYGIQ